MTDLAATETPAAKHDSVPLTRCWKCWPGSRSATSRLACRWNGRGWPERLPTASTTTSSARTFTRWGTPPPQVNGAEAAHSARTAKRDAVPAVRLGAAHTELRGTKVLVVDDDMRNICALTALLERSSAEVVHAQSGFAALEILEQHRDFTVVLMDIMMPIMDGYETIRAIRSSGHSSRLPIIAVTGKAVGGERHRCLAAGADDYVPKPVNSAQLLVALAPWVSPPAKAS